MKHLIFKSSFHEKLTRLLALMLILVASVNQAKADTNISFSGGYIYFADECNVHQGSTQLCGRKSNCSGGDWYTAVTTLSNIGHTKLYYTSSLEGSGWSNVCWAGWALISNSSGKSNSGTEYWSGSNSTWYSNFNSYGFNSGSTYLITVASASKGASATTSYKSSGYSALNNNQTVYKYTSSGETSAASYTAQSVNSGTVTISAYKMTGNGTASNSSNSGTINTASATSTTKPAAFTGEVTLTASANSGYTFMGWFASTSATTAVSTETTYTYNAPNSTKSIYARFKAEATHSVTHTEYCTSTSTQLSTETVSVGEVTYSEFSAPVKAGYTFVNWTYGNGISLKAGDSNTSNPIHVKTLSSGTYTLRANYTEDLTTTWYIAGATGTNYPFTGWGTSGIRMEKKTGHSTEEIYYCNVVVNRVATGNEYEFQTYNSANDTYYGYNNKDITKENNSTTVYSGNPNNMHFKPYLTGTYEFKLDNTGANPVLTVTWPVYNQVRISAASPTADATNVGNFDLGAAVSNVRSVTRSLKANDTYTFKVVSNSEWYGYNSGAFTRSTSTSSNSLTTSTSGGDMTLTTDYAGDYTFKFNESTKALSVDFPAAYKVTYGKGSVNGSSGSCSAIDLDNGSATVTSNSTWVLSGHRVKLTAPDEKSGYSWKGWYGNNAGTGDAISANKVCTLTVSSAKTAYACYTENQYNATVSAGAGGSVSPNGTVAIKQVNGTSITATPSTNYVFKDWTISGGGITPTTSTSATQIFKATTTGGAITANFADQWNVKGDQWDSWATYQAMPYAGTANTFSKTFTLPQKTTYHFKVVKRAAPGGSDVWYGVNNGKTLTRTSNSVTGLEANGGETEYITFTTDVAGDYTITYLYNGAVGSMKVTVTYPTAYTVTFGKGTGGNTISATATNPSGAISSGDYVASGATVTFSQTALAGYTFKGWYTTVDGNTSAGVNGSNQLTINGTKTVYAQYTPNTYTVSFDNNGGSGATPGNITVTYGQAYGTLPVGPTPPGADQFVGWFTDKTGGTQVTSSTIVSTASDHKLWARFESTFTVTVQYKCGADVLRAPTTTHASETSVAAEITAPEILGYSFVNWTGDNATFADATSATTTVNVTSATTVVANYVAHPTLYFKNNLSWDDVYVTFDCNWVTAGEKQVPGNNGKPYFKMTQLGNSDIFYCAIPDTYTSSDYAGWKNNIAFDNHGFSSSGDVGTQSGGFNAGAFLGRSDFDPLATMFIPYDGDSESRNGGIYYRTGCWLRYNSTNSGYRVQVNEWKEGDHADSYLVDLTSDVAGGTEFKATVHMDAQPSGYEYGFKLYKHNQKNSDAIWYSNTGDIHPTTNTLPWHFWTDDVTAISRRCGLEKEAHGDYVFTVSFGTGRPVVNVTYPVSAGDYRLVYKDLATWSNGEHTSSWNHPSRVIKAKANAEDIVSFYIAYGSSPSILLQKCTSIDGSGNPVWNAGTSVTIGATAKGIYNYKVTQDAEKKATVTFDGGYDGNFYIRTDVSDGGWSNYKTSGANNMTYSEYSLTHGGDFGPYSHYFMRHVNDGSNIKFCIANDYSQCISDTVVDDTYAHEWIEAEANIRFMWYNGTNKIGRAYVSGSSNIYDRFLVLEGDDKLFDADGHPLTGTYQVAGLNEYEMNFTDDQNWVYETTVQAKPNERVKLTAKFNNKVQYFYGKEGARTEANTHQLIGGTGSTMYKMRVVYDFKTNRLLAAWLPNGDISDPTPINADVMIIRYHQDDAQQITFSGDGKLTDVKTVYGAMEFNKYRLNNQKETEGHGDLGLSPYERDLFFISFPFDVKLNDVFGFGQYGKHWIIEYYDGKTRAKNGYWKDSPTNWKFVTKAMKDSYTLKANEGYVLALDLDELKLESSVWNYGVENVYLYFPSTATVENIQATSATVNIDTVGYQCTINRNTTQGDRRVKDSHWHLIGVPSYANADHSTSDSWAESKGDLEQTIYYPNIDPAAWTSAAPFVYDWDASSNKFGVLRATSYSFKPMHSYLVQYARDTLEWRQVNTTPAAIAARRAMFAKEPCDFRLELLQDENVIDQAFISMRDDEEVTAEFDFNYDLSKMLYGAFTSKSNIYTFAGNEEVAANCLPFKEETTVVPVGLTVDEEGEYIFSIPDGTSGVGVTLVDNERQIRTNLALTDYMTYLEAGEHNERFVIEISPIEQIVTGVEMINGENGDASLNGEKVTGVCKKLIDGLLYIVKDGKVFDARGARLQ